MSHFCRAAVHRIAALFICRIVFLSTQPVEASLIPNSESLIWPLQPIDPSFPLERWLSLPDSAQGEIALSWAEHTLYLYRSGTGEQARTTYSQSWISSYWQWKKRGWKGWNWPGARGKSSRINFPYCRTAENRNQIRNRRRETVRFFREKTAKSLAFIYHNWSGGWLRQLYGRPLVGRSGIIALSRLGVAI